MTNWYLEQQISKIVDANLTEETIDVWMQEVDNWVDSNNLKEMQKFLNKLEQFINISSTQEVYPWDFKAIFEKIYNNSYQFFVQGFYLINQLRNSIVKEEDKIKTKFASIENGNIAERELSFKDIFLNVGIYPVHSLEAVKNLRMTFKKKPAGRLLRNDLSSQLIENLITVSKRKGNKRINGGWAYEIVQTLIEENKNNILENPHIILDKKGIEYGYIVNLINTAQKNRVPFYKSSDIGSYQLKMWNDYPPSLVNLNTIYIALNTFLKMQKSLKEWTKKQKTSLSAEQKNIIMSLLFTTASKKQVVQQLSKIGIEKVEELIDTIIKESEIDLQYNINST